MKNLMTAFLAITVTASASATQLQNAGCPTNPNLKVSTAASTCNSEGQGKNDVKNAAENKIGLIHYNQVMQSALYQVEKEKEVNAIENLEAEASYNNLMANLVDKIENEKLEIQMEDLASGERFENLMVSLMHLVATP